MRIIFTPLKFILLAMCLALAVFTSTAIAQTPHRKAVSKRDSLRKSILRRDSMMRTFKRSDTSVNTFLQKVEYYNTTFNQIKSSLTRGIDTAEISAQLPRFEKRVTLIKKLIDGDKSSTLRYLYTIRDLLTRSDDQLDDWQEELTSLNGKLIQSENELSQMWKDSILRTVPTDTALVTTFMAQKQAIIKKWKQLDALNKRLLLKTGMLQNRVAAVYISILDQTDQIDQKIRDFGNRALSCESNYLWDMRATTGSSFSQALSKTLTMNTKLLSFMLNRDTIIHISALLLFALFLSWIYYNRRKILVSKDNPENILSQTTYTAKYPVLSALLITTVIAPNFYDHPPIVFLELFFIVLLVTILLLVRKTENKPLFNYLLQLFCIALVFSASNLFVEIANVDRVIVLLLSILSVIITFRFIRSVKLDTSAYPPSSRIILRVFIILQLISVVCNIFGRFSLSKIIAITAIYNLWLALGVYYMVQILMESLFLQLEANKTDTGISSYIDFKVLQTKLRNVLNIVAFVLWLIMLTQNLSIEDFVFDYVGNILTQSHNIGKAGSFTFGSIIIFVAVIWLSSVAAKVISYIYDFADQHRAAPLFKKKPRTSILVIKIAIFAVGFLVAVMASGVPLDKVTIVISAFGVGIGFGLQNIVNNLVSGLILAFEKPVQVGDIIEVTGKSGTITDIGIRSSRIAAGDGAEVIIPNGDLISSHVINWTLSNSNRRVELIINVAYGSEIAKVQTILTGILTNRDDVMTAPAPTVYLHNLSESSVDFRILFWAADISMWQSLKSSILTEIYNKLNEAGIGLPFPQREVYVHFSKDDDKTGTAQLEE